MGAPGETYCKSKFTWRGALVACAVAVVAATMGVAQGNSQNAQQKQNAAPEAASLERTFLAHEVREYSIQLNVHVELPDGAVDAPDTKLPFHGAPRVAEVTVSWHVAERIVSVDTDGTAEVEESLSHFRIELTPNTDRGAADMQGTSLQRALCSKLEAWAAPAERALRYRETRRGELAGFDASIAPNLEEVFEEDHKEDAPPVETEWLVAALRPAVALPHAPMNAGDRWRQPFEIEWKGWSNIRAYESGEWLKPSDATSGNAISLLTSRQIMAKVAATPEKAADGTAVATFHAESLATLSLWDGHTISATRSAARDVARSLAPVAALERPAVVHQRLAVQVEIRECPGGCGGQ
jgi:hypothetical protein